MTDPIMVFADYVTQCIAHTYFVYVDAAIVVAVVVPIVVIGIVLMVVISFVVWKAMYKHKGIQNLMVP